MYRSLYFRLSVALVLLFLFIGLALVALTRYSGSHYYQEVTQRLNAPLAMYVAGEAPLIEQGTVNRVAMKTLAHQAMVINPTVEVYLLDPDGHVLGHELGGGIQTRSRIDMEPVKRFLQGDASFPLLGDDPRTLDQRKIFTAAEVSSGNHLEGYVYVVLGGQKYEQLAASAEVSEVMRLSTLAVIACVLFGLGSALLIFARLSLRLRVLTRQVNDYCAAAMDCDNDQTQDGDEVVRLSKAFGSMQYRIEQQMTQLRLADRQRRELVAHISHDLRTPLATMQGYIETLSLKRDLLSAEQQRSYLDIARKHGVRLGRLINDLFELARLDAGLVEPHWDRFCLAELLADIAQEYRLAAERRGLALQLDRHCDDCAVRGDIRLIERVITNLLENALRHTPEGGRITLSVGGHAAGVRLTITDTGAGIPEKDLQRVFERGYTSDGNGQNASTGLGLAIVRRILDLHHAEIVVNSRSQQGTVFSFSLDATGG